MRVKKLPMILALHLKRFKYVEQYNRHIKVSHRVVFPLELRLFNTVSIHRYCLWKHLNIIYFFLNNFNYFNDNIFKTFNKLFHCLNIIYNYVIWL